jgi:hypothetical protein
MATTSRPARARRLVPVALVSLALVAGACGGGGKKEATPKPTTTTEETTTTVAAPSSPLTGVPQPDAAKLARPALIVKVDNTPKGFVLQEGIDKADIVFVEQTEQGTTRLAAVFQSQDATVGPVRSARTSDVGIAGALNHPMLAYSGANGGVLRQVRSGPLVDVGIDAAGATPIYTRNQRGTIRNLYRFFLPTDQVYAAKGSLGKTPPPLFHYRAAGQAATGDPAKGARVGYGGGAATTVNYQWDETLKGWARTQNGRVHVMAKGGARIAPANVVILVTPYRNSGFRDVTGAISPQAVLEGGGEAWFLSDGKVVKGRWARPGPVGAFSFTDAAGAPVALTPGQTFIELAPAAGAAAIL